MITTLESLALRGRQPWLPCSAATELNVWNDFGTPSLGTFETPNGAVLFYSVDGKLMHPDFEDEMWGYLPISDDEYEELRAARYANMESMESDVVRRLNDRPIVVAWSVLGVIQAHTDDIEGSEWSVKTDAFRERLTSLLHSGQLTLAVYFERTGQDADDSSRSGQTNSDMISVPAGDLVLA